MQHVQTNDENQTFINSKKFGNRGEFIILEMHYIYGIELLENLKMNFTRKRGICE
jgi:hypothetical protein